ncbi:hypothetical protein EON79_11180 [bacterium]|nr:MAG: hypothetical protein EON79_11180 [bacterium]
MSDGPWDLPLTEEGLQTLLGRLEESHVAGDEAAVAWGMLALAKMVKWVRSDTVESPFVRAAHLSEGASEIFRRLGDERGLLAALRASTTFVSPDTTEARLNEAMEIAERLGDRREIARTLAAQGRALTPGDPKKKIDTTRRALAEFEALDDKAGQAQCLFTLSIRLETNEEKHAMAREAAELFREIGDRNQASKSVTLAVMYGESFLDFPTLEPLIRQGLADAEAAGDLTGQAMFHGHLAKVAAAKGDAAEVTRCLARQKELDQSDSLTPRERRQGEIEMMKTIVTMAKASGDKESIAGFQSELRRLRRAPL